MEEFYNLKSLKNIKPSIYKDETAMSNSNIKGKCSCCLKDVTYS